jgi:hypothetical protein
MATKTDIQWFCLTFDVTDTPYEVNFSSCSLGINETVVAVTLAKAKKVIFIDLNHDNVVKSFNTVGECYGIDHVANRFAVSVQGIGIQIFDDEGILIKTIPLACTALVFLKSNICYVKAGSNVLRCCDLEGSDMWELKLPVIRFLGRKCRVRHTRSTHYS